MGRGAFSDRPCRGRSSRHDRRDVVEEAPAGAEEVLAVVVGVERDHVSAQEAGQNLLAPRQSGDDLRRWTGDVEKEANGAVGAPAAKQVGDEQELVVVHPAQSTSGAGPGLGSGKALVDGPVGLPPSEVVHRRLDQAVQERPQRPVGEAVVVGSDLPPAQRHRAEVDVEPGDPAGEVAPAAVPSHPGRFEVLSSAGLSALAGPTRGRLPALRPRCHGKAVGVGDEPPQGHGLARRPEAGGRCGCAHRRGCAASGRIQNARRDSSAPVSSTRHPLVCRRPCPTRRSEAAAAVSGQGSTVSDRRPAGVARAPAPKLAGLERAAGASRDPSRRAGAVTRPGEGRRLPHRDEPDQDWVLEATARAATPVPRTRARSAFRRRWPESGLGHAQRPVEPVDELERLPAQLLAGRGTSEAAAVTPPQR